MGFSFLLSCEQWIMALQALVILVLICVIISGND